MRREIVSGIISFTLVFLFTGASFAANDKSQIKLQIVVPETILPHSCSIYLSTQNLDNTFKVAHGCKPGKSVLHELATQLVLEKKLSPGNTQLVRATVTAP